MDRYEWSAVRITIASGTGGSGPGPVQIAIAANNGAARSGTITIAGRSLTVAQATGCAYSVQPLSQDVGGGGGTVTVSVSTAAGCSWNATSAVDWITLSSAGGDVSRGDVHSQRNASPPRTGTVTVAGHTVTITQASVCRWLFAPPSHEFSASGGNGNVLVIVTGSCSWTAVPTVPWIQITAGGSGTGGALLQFVGPGQLGRVANRNHHHRRRELHGVQSGVGDR